MKKKQRPFTTDEKLMMQAEMIRLQAAKIKKLEAKIRALKPPGAGVVVKRGGFLTRVI